MSKKASLILSATTGLSLALGGAVAVAPSATAQAVPSGDGAGAAAVASDQERVASQDVQLDRVEGRFSFDQTAVDGNETIAKAIGKASATLCGASEANDFPSTGTGEAWDVEVGGDVRESFVLAEADLDENDYELRAMKCACAGNPADGKSTVGAQVAGVPLTDIIQRAQPNEGVNTIVFTSSDGFEVALPLKYVTQRASILVYKINDECLDASVGGNNQLWLGMTSARYFARDIVKVEFEARETPPPAPGSADEREAYPNNPNVGVLSGQAGDQA